MSTFVDTSFLIAFVLTDDEHHRRAFAWNRAIRSALLTTEYVLIEFLDALWDPPLRPLAVETVSVLRRRPAVRVVPASTSLFDDALAMFHSHRDKEWGLTDCVSFIVMRREGVMDALTSDHHFEQGGFRALLRSDPP